MSFRQRPPVSAPDATVVADSPLAIMLVCTVGGTVIGVILELLWAWLTAQPWGPDMGPTKLLTVLPTPWPTVAAAAAGAIAGLVLGAKAVHDSLSVTVSAESVLLTSEDEEEEFARAEIGHVYLKDKHLVLLDQDGAELTRRPCELSARRVSNAFVQYGYPWTKGKPRRKPATP